MDTKPAAFDPESETILTSTNLDTNEGKVILSNKINKEIDKIFGPAIQRNRSGSDIDIIGPFRRRHYWSQERLFADKPLHSQVGDISNHELNSFQIDELKSLDESKNSQIPVLHENQRAEIVASVTERLYSKLKKNEKVSPKIDSVLDKKGIQPLSELKICSNARQRLMELSQKALRNKRRIGIPAYTQTKSQVTRVKNQGIEIQTDLQSFVDLSQHYSYSLRKDASIQTELITPRFKEKAVGSNYDTVIFSNKDSTTQTNVAAYKNNETMTHIENKNNHSTQTISFQQPKIKSSDLPSKKCSSKIDSLQSAYKDDLSPFIKIHISPIYSHGLGDSSDSEGFTEDESESLEENILISNKKENLENTMEYKVSRIYENEVQNEFSDDECSVLPRALVDPIRNIDIDDYEELILGRNKDTYPYNIKLSPCRNIDESKRMIKFEDSDLATDVTGCTESRLQIPKPEYSNEQVTNEIESIQQSTVKKNPTNLENDNDKQIKCNNIKKYEYSTIENCSPVRLQNKFDANVLESDTSLYYSLNSFFILPHKKRTPTEYLHYLIQKRRAAISMDNSRFYQRNIDLHFKTH